MQKEKFRKSLNALSLGKKMQLAAAVLLTAGLIASYPVYSWFRMQRQIQRYEKISSPTTLYITAGHREKPIYFDVGGIDVKGTWKELNGTQSQATYQDYVFCVAGAYVPTYTLQLAHTQNNPFTYTIYEATVSDTRPGGVPGKDYITYIVTEDFSSEEIRDITDDPVFEGLQTGGILYYSVKMNQSEPVQVNGRYLNMRTTGEDAGLADSAYHEQTYHYDDVEKHSEPLYWQANGITGGYNGENIPFYHQYILRVSWDPETISNTYKDTDIIYIMAQPE